MSLLDLDLDNVQPPEVAPSGTETTVRIANAVEKDESHCIVVWFGLPEFKEAPEFSYLVSLPNPDKDSESQQYRKLQQIKDFLNVMGTDSQDVEEWVGLEATAVLGERSYQGKDTNTIMNFVTAG